jgi:cytochrome c-type biogenesis protein
MVFRAVASPAGLTDIHLFAFAAVAGVASFFSPCAFPLLPSYLAFYSSADGAGRGRALQLGLAAALGVVSFDLLLGLAIALIGGGFGESISISGDNPSRWLLIFRGVIGFTLLVLGLGQLAGWNLKPRGADALAYWSRPQPRSSRRPEASLFLYGLGYNAAGMGCTGPILAGLVIASLASGGFASALAAFLIFALTMGLLMLVISLLVGASRQQLIMQLKSAAPRIRTLGALAMVAAGLFQLYSAVNLNQFLQLLFP